MRGQGWCHACQLLSHPSEPSWFGGPNVALKQAIHAWAFGTGISQLRWHFGIGYAGISVRRYVQMRLADQQTEPPWR